MPLSSVPRCPSRRRCPLLLVSEAEAPVLAPRLSIQGSPIRDPDHFLASELILGDGPCPSLLSQGVLESCHSDFQALSGIIGRY